MYRISLSQLFVLIRQGLGSGSGQLLLIGSLLRMVDLDLWRCQSHLLHKVKVCIPACTHTPHSEQLQVNLWAWAADWPAPAAATGAGTAGSEAAVGYCKQADDTSRRAQKSKNFQQAA